MPNRLKGKRATKESNRGGVSKNTKAPRLLGMPFVFFTRVALFVPIKDCVKPKPSYIPCFRYSGTAVPNLSLTAGPF